MTSGYEISVTIDDAFSELVGDAHLGHVATAALTHQHVRPGAAMAIVVLDGDRMHQLNKQYRGIDGPTDVLSFAMQEGEAVAGPDEAQAYLGDVIIAYPTAARQASDAGHSVADEIDLLLVHGCLHLLGYDHNDDDQKARMWHEQDAILAQVGSIPNT